MFSAPNKKPVVPASLPATPTKAETAIGTNTRVVGTITSDGHMRIDGSVEGDIVVLGNLIIGETGRVVANVKAQTVHVSGAIKGQITADAIEISPTGKVWGDITTDSLHVEPGGFFRGQSAMMAQVEEPLLLEAPRAAELDDQETPNIEPR